MYQSGIILGFFSHIITLALGIYSMYLLLEWKNLTQYNSYAGIGYQAFGRWAIFFVSGITVFMCCGMPISALFQDMTFQEETPNGHGKAKHPYYFLLKVIIIITLGYFWIQRTVFSLKLLSTAAVVVTVLVWLMMILSMLVVDNSNSLSDFMMPHHPINNYFETIPTVLFAYSLHPSFFTIFKSLKDQKDNTAWLITKYSLGFAGSVYFIITLSSLIMFGNKIKGDMLINLALNNDDTFEYFCSCLFILMAILHTPVIFFIAKEAILTIYWEAIYQNISEDKPLYKGDANMSMSDNIFTRYIRREVNMSYTLHWTEYYPITIILYIFIIVVSITIDDIEQYFAILGSLWATLLSFILPPIFYLQLQEGTAPTKTIFGAVVVLTYGILILFLGSYTTLIT